MAWPGSEKADAALAVIVGPGGFTRIARRICLPREIPAEPLPRVAYQRIDIDVFDCLTVRYVLPVHDSEIRD